ncbi:uncharacterized protein LOC144157771 [Haemaphysalis longicornis]
MLPVVHYGVSRLLVLTATLLLQDFTAKADCDIRGSYSCYWDVASKLGLKHFTNVPENKTHYLADFCPPPGYFPEENICAQHYSGCTSEEKLQFQTMEEGYASLQNLTSNQRMCTAVGKLRECADFDVMRNCSDREEGIPDENFEELKSKKKWSAVQLWLCVEYGLRRCNLVYHAGRTIYVYGIANAVIKLNTPYLSAIPRAASTTLPAKTTPPPVVNTRSSFIGGYPLYASWVTYGHVVLVAG